MTRVRVSFDEREYGRAKKEAKALGVSLAEFVRRAVRNTLAQSSIAPWMRYAGFVESRNPQSSHSLDEIVYGSKN